jgi:hypothetical protein
MKVAQTRTPGMDESSPAVRLLLSRRRNKGLRHKLVLYALIAMLLVANGYAIYWLFTKK